MMKGKAVKVMTIGAFILGVTLPRVVAQDEPVYYLNGDAVVTGEDCYQLTPAINTCLLYTSPSPRDRQKSRMPSSA